MKADARGTLTYKEYAISIIQHVFRGRICRHLLLLLYVNACTTSKSNEPEVFTFDYLLEFCRKISKLAHIDIPQ